MHVHACRRHAISLAILPTVTCIGLGLGILPDLSQVVAGMNYHLLMTVRDSSGNTRDISATVWSRPWLEAKNDASDPAWQLTDARVVSAHSDEA